LTPVRSLGEDSNRLPEKATQGLSARAAPGAPGKCRNICRSFCACSRKKQNSKSGSKTPPPFPDSQDLSDLSVVGDLGPKLHEGDRQTPESFCTITPDLMNPNSNYDLAINTGFPNSFDKANNHDGTLLDAEDSLIAALKVKMQRPDALIAYVSQQNKRGDTRHPMRRLSSENAWCGHADQVLPSDPANGTG
jgi:hypothetical protein